MNEWSLDILYRGYYGETFINDFKKMDTVTQRCTRAVERLCHDNEMRTLHDMLSLLEELHTLTDHVGHLISLEQSTNTSDGKTVSLMNQFSQKFSGITKASARFSRYVAEIEDLDACIKQDILLKEYSYLLHTIKEDSTYLLSDDIEDVLSKMSINGGKAWANLQEYLTSIVEVEYKGEVSTLSQIRNTTYDSDAKVRKSAYEAGLEAYSKIRDAVAFSLNSIKTQILTECELRGFASPLIMTLYNAHMKQETLDALLHTMQSYMPKFHAYLRHKTELLGYKNGLPWYEPFAPLGEEAKTYCIERTKEYLLKHLRPFAEDVIDMMERAFDESWIDLSPRKGRVGGAFCANLSSVEQGRVLTNYDGTLGDIITLAHELGHACHGMMVKNHRPLNTDYSIPAAEAASTFNENIIMNIAIEETRGQEKITLIESQLQDLTQIICDIYPRFLFKKTAFGKRKDGFIFADELKAIVTETREQAYGDGLNPNYLHPYIWICKPRYYSSGLDFCNFPYAFGALFARGLIVEYQEEKGTFIPKYRELLKATTVSSVEDVTAVADIDLCDETLWTSCLDTYAQRIGELLELTK